MALDLVTLPTTWPGLSLRQYALADASEIFRLIDASRPHLSQHGDDTATKYPTLASVAESIRVNNPAARLRLGIWQDEKLVGGNNLTCSLESAEVGYWLGAAHLGQGYATIATQTIVDYAHAVLGYATVTAKVKKANGASLAVLQRVGFNYFEGEDPAYFYLQHLLPAP